MRLTVIVLLLLSLIVGHVACRENRPQRRRVVSSWWQKSSHNRQLPATSSPSSAPTAAPTGLRSDSTAAPESSSSYNLYMASLLGPFLSLTAILWLTKRGCFAPFPEEEQPELELSKISSDSKEYYVPMSGEDDDRSAVTISTIGLASVTGWKPPTGWIPTE